MGRRRIRLNKCHGIAKRKKYYIWFHLKNRKVDLTLKLLLNLTAGRSTSKKKIKKKNKKRNCHRTMSYVHHTKQIRRKKNKKQKKKEFFFHELQSLAIQRYFHFSRFRNKMDTLYIKCYQTNEP